MYSKTYTIRWADLDANIHMRHSAYNDYAAQTRLLFMAENGFGMEWFKEHNVFPVLFREETIFLKEIHGNENIRIDAILVKMSEDGSRWSIMNHFYKSDGTLAAKLTVDGAWMDIVARKLKSPPKDLMHLFDKLEKSAEFVVTTRG
ncbi:MAG: thioesterase family protein [Bacteroidetes bacterium]|nr:thioesterase family protein [Bacteroidota bacterium]